VEECAVPIHFQIGNVEAAAQIAAHRPLDLHDASTEVSEPQRAGRTGKKLAEIKDQQSGKRSIV
jgi:hypothetical protein